MTLCHCSGSSAKVQYSAQEWTTPTAAAIIEQWEDYGQSGLVRIDTVPHGANFFRGKTPVTYTKYVMLCLQPFTNHGLFVQYFFYLVELVLLLCNSLGDTVARVMGRQPCRHLRIALGAHRCHVNRAKIRIRFSFSIASIKKSKKTRASSRRQCP